MRIQQLIVGTITVLVLQSVTHFPVHVFECGSCKG